MKQTNCTMFLFAVNWYNPCQYLTILGDTWRYLAIHDNTFTILSNTKQYQFLTIPNNTKQYLTNLVSVGIGWYCQSFKYCRQYHSSIMKVSSRYGSDVFLSVWYRHGTDSGDFHKTFDPQFWASAWDPHIQKKNESNRVNYGCKMFYSILPTILN